MKLIGDCPITASGIVYLFANEFVEIPVRPRFTPLDSKVDVPCTSYKVNLFWSSWPCVIVTAAFIWLEVNGFMTLSIRKKNELLGGRRLLRDFIIAERKGEISGINPASLESRLWKQAHQEIKVLDLAFKTIGSFSPPPEKTIIKQTREYLSKEGYFFPRRKWKIFTKWTADCQRISELKRHINGTKRMIEHFRESELILYHELLKDVEKAVRAYRYTA